MKYKSTKNLGKEILADIKWDMEVYLSWVSATKNASRKAAMYKKKITNAVAKFPKEFKPLYEDQLNRIKNKI